MVANLSLDLVKVEPNNRESLLNALRSLSEIDCDFSGDNGFEYNWDITNEEGFDSNVDYVINEVKDIDDDLECINKFLAEWMGDDYYYQQYEMKCLTDDNGNIIAISLATVSGS